MTRYNGNLAPRKPRRSGKVKSLWRRVAESWPCETCGAAPGRGCVTTGGHPAATPHTARTALASANDWRPPQPQETP